VPPEVPDAIAQSAVEALLPAAKSLNSFDINGTAAAVAAAASNDDEKRSKQRQRHRRRHGRRHHNHRSRFHVSRDADLVTDVPSASAGTLKIRNPAHGVAHAQSMKQRSSTEASCAQTDTLVVGKPAHVSTSDNSTTENSDSEHIEEPNDLASQLESLIFTLERDTQQFVNHMLAKSRGALNQPNAQAQDPIAHKSDEGSNTMQPSNAAAVSDSESTVIPAQTKMLPNVTSTSALSLSTQIILHQYLEEREHSSHALSPLLTLLLSSIRNVRYPLLRLKALEILMGFGTNYIHVFFSSF
jgi:hypothetical protein